MREPPKIKEIAPWPAPRRQSFVVAGPCSAESEDQLMRTAQGLAKVGIDVLRAGIWKARTRGGSFEGVGSKGLAWLKRAGAAAGLPVAVEVAKPQHVEACLAQGVEYLWIGARTTANPFSVQELAEALRGVDVPVMIKNPLNPDLELWIGAIERISSAGVKCLAMIHRGFSTYKNTGYRNQPLWSIPLELKRLLPGMPLFCDPSHICGRVDCLQEVAQRALDLLFDGLVFESHINPSEALSDRQQQVTPEHLGLMLSRLRPRQQASGEKQSRELLEMLRREIDEIDRDIVGLLAARMELSRKIGAHKRSKNISIFQPARWSEVVRSRSELGRAKGLSEDFLQEIFQRIHEESIRQQ